MTGAASPSLSSLLLVLEKKLTDQQLRDFFPDSSPLAIRKSLHQGVKKLTGRSSGGSGPRTSRQQSLLPTTKPGPGGRLVLYTDGASRGNPGEAGAGIHILDDKGLEVHAAGCYLGRCTNNMAEYQALLLGLQAAANLGGTDLTVNLDSELIVRQINGQYQVKDAKLRPLFDEAITLLKRFDDYRVQHVPRAENRRADQLANEGIDNKAC